RDGPAEGSGGGLRRRLGRPGAAGRRILQTAGTAKRASRHIRESGAPVQSSPGFPGSEKVPGEGAAAPSGGPQGKPAAPVLSAVPSQQLVDLRASQRRVAGSTERGTGRRGDPRPRLGPARAPVRRRPRPPPMPPHAGRTT